jgi:hypothetical protein
MVERLSFIWMVGYFGFLGKGEENQSQQSMYKTQFILFQDDMKLISHVVASKTDEERLDAVKKIGFSPGWQTLVTIVKEQNGKHLLFFGS